MQDKINKYIYPKGDFISGFGGGYEEDCQKMVIVGMEWLDEHPEADLKFREYKNVTGILIETTPEAKELTKIMNESIGNEATGAMMQACVNHVLYANKYGWDEYLTTITKNK